MLLACATLGACGSTLFIRRAVYVHDGQIVRLREPVRAKVWVSVDPDGKDGPEKPRWEPTEMTLPEGWYATYLPPGEGEQDAGGTAR